MPQKILPYGRQQIEQDDIDAVVATLKHDFLTTGPKVAEFEDELIKVTGAKHAISCSNGTTALHLACEALELKAGDAAIVPSVTFLATANAIRYTGAEVVFCDVDPQTGLMTADTLQKSIASMPKELTLKAVFAVHLKGLCVDLKALRKIADQHDLKIVADSCHAIGGQLYDNPVGACVYEDMATFSFHPVKTIAMGEGGAVTTNNTEWAEKIKRLRSHGMINSPESPMYPDNAVDEKGNKNPWYYEMPDVGYNYRLTDIQCALGVSQLRKIKSFVQRREEITQLYDSLLDGVSAHIAIPKRLDYCQPGWHLYAPQFDFEALGITRAEFMQKLREQNVLTQVHYFPVHRQPYYVQRYGDINLLGADDYYKSTLSLPLYPSLDDKDVERVVEVIKSILKEGI